MQFLLAVGVLGLFLGPCRSSTLLLAGSLAQVSEFSFVMASRARRTGVISREVGGGFTLHSLSGRSLSVLGFTLYSLQLRVMYDYLCVCCTGVSCGAEYSCTELAAVAHPVASVCPQRHSEEVLGSAHTAATMTALTQTLVFI